MEVKHIKEKLDELGFKLDDFVLGDFDQIGEFTAKKQRSNNDPLYKSVGAYFRPNYERGILLSALIKKFEVKSVLEIGFGRGYSALCAVKAFCEMGYWDSKVITVDPNIDEVHMKKLTEVFPSNMLNMIGFMHGKSEDVLPKLKDFEFDLIYIDGDHTYEAVKKDWELVKDSYKKCLLFDDYHLPGKDSGPGIQVAKLVDEIDVPNKELIRMDRRIFVDDRGKSDAEIDYGQVLITR